MDNINIEKDTYILNIPSTTDIIINTVSYSTIQLNKEKRMSISLDGPLFIGSNNLQKQVNTNTADIANLQEDVSDIRTDMGSLDNLATSDKTSLVNAINETLSVLDPTQTADYIKNSKGLKSGEVSSNSAIYPWVEEMSHSTFDRSKFTVVGSPNITDDGIASWFSSSNYLNIGNTISYTNFIGHSFKITCGFTHKSTTANTNQALFQMYSANALQSVRTYNDKVVCSLNTSAYSEKTLTPTLVDGNFYTVTLEHDKTTSKYVLSLYDNNNVLLGSDDTFATGDLVFNETDYSHFYIGRGITNVWANLGSIDLKQFSITVDGVEVFSGNKTGIDTIKPDDYAVVGTPTISSDGVVTNFSESNYVRKGELSVNSTDFVYKCKIKTPSTSGSRAITSFFISSNLNCYIDMTSANNLYFRYYNSSNAQQFRAFAYPASLNTEYELEVHTKGTQVTLYCNGVNKGTWNDYAPTAEGNISVINIGTLNSNYDTGATIIDLNSIKLYSEGDLDYQPCLLIPYTESKTGSKIVNAIYRDRVNDMAEQFGYANYYTLDEDNGNFTLPQVELYGLIRRQSDRPSDKYISLSLGASGDTYMAPADGYFMLNKASANEGEYAVLTNEANGLATINSAVTAGNNIRVWLPVKKNDVIKLQYTTTGITNLFRFIYSVGSESEAN